MATFTKYLLSGSVNGQQILVTATGSSSATPIHTTPSGTGSLDEIYLYVCNNSTSSLLVSVLWGGTVEPNNLIRTTLYPSSGRLLIADGMLLTNGLSISSYAQSGSFVTVDGFVNRIQ